MVLTQKNVFNLCSRLGTLPPEGWRGQDGEAGPLNHNAPISSSRDLAEPAILNVLNAYMVLEQILVVSFWVLICIRDVRQREQVKMAKREKKNDESEAAKAFTNDFDFWIFYLNLNGNIMTIKKCMKKLFLNHESHKFNCAINYIPCLLLLLNTYHEKQPDTASVPRVSWSKCVQPDTDPVP